MDAQTLLNRIQAANVLAADCPSRQVLTHVTSRWGALVMIALATGTHRFSALRRRIGGVSERMLAQTLQQLEGDGMVRRVAHDVVPPHVDYSLTPLGVQAAEKVVALSAWIEVNLAEILAGRPAAKAA
jgi:DNA-binding HxlR family transcriptional regulator